MEKKVDYEYLKQLSVNSHKVKAWLFTLLSEVELHNIDRAEKTEKGNQVIIEINWANKI